MSLRLLPFLLVLAACKSPTDTGQPPAVGQLDSGLTLLDDFSEGSIDGVWRWGGADTVSRSIDSGAAVLSFDASDSLVPGLTGADNTFTTPVGVHHDEIAATFTLDDFSSIGSDSEVLLGMDYATGSDSELMVTVGFHTTSSSGLILSAGASTCTSGSCQPVPGSSFDFSGIPVGSNVDPSVSHRLSLSYDGSANRILLGFDDYQGVLDTSQVDGFSPDGFQYAEISAHGSAMDAQGYEARAKVHVSDVEVDGASYGAFTGSHLDLTKWQQGDLVRRVQDGALVLGAGSQDENTGVELPLRDFSGVTELAAQVTVDEYTWDGTDTSTAPVAGLGGFWYDEGTGGDGSGGVAGQVYASIGVSGGTDVGWKVVRCNSSDCSDSTVLGSDSLGSLDVGTAEDLYIAWNGTWFTFQRGSQEPATFNPATAASTPAGPATAGWKGLMVRYPYGAGGKGYVQASFQDVRTNPTAQIDLSVGGTAAGWPTAAAQGSNLSSLVCLGTDPNDSTLAMLHAVQGASNGVTCDGSSCAMLDLFVPDATWSAGDVISATAQVWDPASSTWTDGSGSLVVDSAHAPGQHVQGRFNGTLSDGTAVDASFDAPWLPAATVPPLPATQDAPKSLDTACSVDPFCVKSASTGRTTWFRLPTTPGETRALRAWGGDAVVSLDDADGTALCSATSTPDAPSDECTGTASGDHLLVEIAGKAGASQVVSFSVSEPFTDLQPGKQVSGSVPPSGHRWYRLRTGPAGLGWLVTDYPHDTNAVNMTIYDRLGQRVSSTDYCCTGTRSTHEFAIPPDRSGGAIWLHIASDGYGHAYDLVARQTGTGASASDPVAHTLAVDNSSSLTYLLGDHQSLWVTFNTTRSGAYQLRTEGLGADGGPLIDWNLVTDPTDPTNSSVRTDSGTGCSGARVGGSDVASCWALLQPSTTYYVQLQEQDGAPAAPASFEVDVPSVDETIVSPDQAFPVNLNPAEQADFVAWPEAGNGYNLTFLGAAQTVQASFLDVDGYVIREVTASNGPTFGMPLMGSEVQAFLHVRFYDWSSSAVALTATVETHGTGEQPTSPIQIPLLTTSFVEDDTLSASSTRYYEFLAPLDNSYTIAVLGDSFGPMEAIPWTLFSDPNGSPIITCPSSLNTSSYQAICSVSLSASTPYYLRVGEAAGLSGVHYQLVQ